MKSEKVLDYSNNGFSETIKQIILNCSNFSGNNNKFYSLEIQKNPNNEYRIFSHYGRLGITNIFEKRDNENGQPITDISFIEKEFDDIIKKKLKGKKIKDEDGERIEKYELVDVFSPSVGSENVRGKSIKIVETKISTKDVLSSYSHPEVSRIIKQIIEENIHNISSLTSLKLTSNGFETPLGPVTKEHIQKSKEPLDILKSLLVNGKLNKSLKSVVENNNKYFSLIPHPFSHKIQESDWILDDIKLAEEFEMLNNLESAVSMGSALQDASKQKNILGVDIDLLEDEKEFKRIEHYIINSKAQNHVGTNIWNYKVKRIFKIKVPNDRNRYESNVQKFDNKRELFHGSKNCNILSILKNGLIVPLVNSSGVTGRMLGNHVYFACNSTKSMNYCTDFWNRSHSSKNKNIFLFLANVNLGNYHTVHSFTPNGIPSGYDSIWAKSGNGLYNDEFVIKKLEQHTLTYMVELQ